MSKDPWTDPDPQPGDFDAFLAGTDPSDRSRVEAHEGDPKTTHAVLKRSARPHTGTNGRAAIESTAMTAKEKLLERVTKLSEAEADETLRLFETWRNVDAWGDLSAMTDAAGGEAMRRLDEEERAEHGETIGEAWGR